MQREQRRYNIVDFPKASPPLYSLEIECGVIGSCLYYPGVYPKVAQSLRQQHFHEAFLGEVYGWIGDQHEAGATGGEALQLACMTAVEHVDTGKATVAHCIGMTLVPVDVPYAVRKLLEFAERRRLLAAAEQIRADATAGSQTLVADAIDAVAGDGEIAAKRTVYVPDEAFDQISKEVSMPCVAYAGTEALHKELGGFHAGRMYVVGGRPGSGKTTVAAALGLHAARRDFGVGYFSLEMTAPEIACRLLASLAFTRDQVISHNRIERRSLSPWEQQRVDEARELLRPLAFEIDDKAAPTIGELRIAVQAMQRRFLERGKRLDVVVVDHLGLIKPSGSYRGNRVAETGEVSSGLKALAKDLNVAVVALCQLSRDVEGRENKKPTMSDLRWAGEIEQDADVVLMVYREAYYLDASDSRFNEKAHLLELLIRKNRGGKTGRLEMYVDLSAGYLRDKET
jgi:replicative DNA helicase